MNDEHAAQLVSVLSMIEYHLYTLATVQVTTSNKYVPERMHFLAIMEKHRAEWLKSTEKEDN